MILLNYCYKFIVSFFMLFIILFIDCIIKNGFLVMGNGKNCRKGNI